MVNDEVNNKAINIEIKVAQYSAKAILKAMKKIIEDAAEKSQPLADYISEKRKTNSRKLKDMVKKGQLEYINNSTFPPIKVDCMLDNSSIITS